MQSSNHNPEVNQESSQTIEINAEQSPRLRIEFGSNTVYQNSPKSGDRPINKMNRSKSLLLAAIVLIAQQIEPPKIEGKIEIKLPGTININLEDEQILHYSKGMIDVNKLTEISKAVVETTLNPETVVQELTEMAENLQATAQVESIMLGQLQKQILDPMQQWLVEEMPEAKAPGPLEEMAAKATATTRHMWEIIKQEIRELQTQQAIEIGKVLTNSPLAEAGTFRGNQFTFQQAAEQLTIARNRDGAVILSSNGETVSSRMTDAELSTIAKSAQVLAEQRENSHRTTKEVGR